MNKTPKTTDIEVDLNDRTYKGRYFTANKMVTVQSFYGSKSAQIGGFPEALLAKTLLREIIENENANGTLDTF